LKQFLDKQKKAQSFDFQLVETTDISDKVQVIVYCRFADDETKTIVKVCCLIIGVCAIARVIFPKLNHFIEEHGFGWTKYKSVASNGAAAMQGSTNGVVQAIRHNSLDCVSTCSFSGIEKKLLKSIRSKCLF